MILLLDNYDSFVHNVARYLRLGGKATRVIRSDEITAEECRRLEPEAIVLSPGPHRPENAGCCLKVVRTLAGEIPILGICLGNQTIAAAYGGNVIQTAPMHGMASNIRHDSTGVFESLPDPMAVGRYHSLAVEPHTLPRSLQVTAWTDDDVIMGVSDHARCVHGVQFHPESLLTTHGSEMIGNFFRVVDRHHARLKSIDQDAQPRIAPIAWSAGSDSTTDEASGLPSAYRATPFPTVSIASSSWPPKMRRLRGGLIESRNK